MTLKRMYPCSFHTELHPNYIEHPEWCSWCHGAMEWEGDADFDGYKGEFVPIDYETIGTEYDDFTIYVNCACGEKAFLGEAGDTKACECGRVFRMSVSIKVDETHIGEADWLIEESKRLSKERYKKWGIETE
jgi:hypothetical protein